MIRYNLYLSNQQDRELRKLHGTRSEHIRRAIDAYIEFMRQQEPLAVTSPSKVIKTKIKGRHEPTTNI